MTTGTEQMAKPYVGMKVTGVDARGVRGPAEIVKIDDDDESYSVRFAFEHQIKSGQVCRSIARWWFDRDGDSGVGLRIEFEPFDTESVGLTDESR